MCGNRKGSSILFLCPTQWLFIRRLSHRNWSQFSVSSSFLFPLATQSEFLGTAFLWSERSVHHITDYANYMLRVGWKVVITHHNMATKMCANPCLAPEAGIHWEATVKGLLCLLAMLLVLCRHLFQLWLESRQRLAGVFFWPGTEAAV